MPTYILKRTIYSIPLLISVSIVAFVLITAPPGDYMSELKNQLVRRSGLTRTEATEIAQQMRERYGLDQPIYGQYWSWISGIITRGDFGYSFYYRKPVSEIIWKRLGWTFAIALTALVFSYVGGMIPGIYSATHQYRASDHLFTVVAFLGLSIPNFFFALVILYILNFQLGISIVGGLFSPQFMTASWSWAKFIDLLKHLWIPVIVVGTAGTAGTMRVMRNNLLDIIGMSYIQTARSKGLRETVVVYKHAVRNALQPIIMSMGMRMPRLITGSAVVAIVLNLPTTGPVLLNAVMSQDMYLAGSFILMIAFTLVIGNLLADIALGVLDPRIRYE